MRLGFLLGICLVGAVRADVCDRLVLATRDGTALPIVLRGGASSSERYAAEELRDYTERLVGVRPEILTDAQPLPEKAIVLEVGEGIADIGGTDGFRLSTS